MARCNQTFDINKCVYNYNGPEIANEKEILKFAAHTLLLNNVAFRQITLANFFLTSSNKCT